MMHIQSIICDVMCGLAMIALIGGCHHGPVPRGHYSGKFRSINSSDHDIFIKICTGFGWESPDAGEMHASGTGGAEVFFDPIPSFPEITTITWDDRVTGKESSQTVMLKGVVPQGVDGVTEFEFGSDYQWTVRFVPSAK
jgi:hypothetical protein